MELSHLLQLVAELPKNSTLDYVRGTDKCKYIDIDIEGQRINSETPTGEAKSWAPTYLAELAPKIKENVPFNLSGLLNNKGSFRPVLETIIAHTREFYTVRKGTATALVWIPTKPKSAIELEEIESTNIPPATPEDATTPIINKKLLSEKLKKGFITYFSNYLRLSTGKCEDSKIEKYLNLYKKYVEVPLQEQIPEFHSIFEYEDVVSLNNFFFEAQEKLPQMSILLLDKWPENKDEQTLYYEPWTMIRHYKVFLELLKAFNQIAISIKPDTRLDKRALNDIQEKHHDYLRAMRTKPFLLLAGISGTGKSRIVKQLAYKSCPDNAELRKDTTSPGNYCLIEVKPNWHDSTELLGYRSQIGSKHYVLTPFIKFLVNAMLHSDTPFFVCLDEMNLAPVEQYFAEFLSVLESRKKKDGHITSEALIKADVFKEFEHQLRNELFGLESSTSDEYEIHATSDPTPHYGKENEVYETLKTEGLRIPENLIVIGTVNMDETTHQFSRKVIDRAMTIEMNIADGEAPFTSFFDDYEELAYADNPLGKDLFLPKFVSASEALAAMTEEDRQFLKDELPGKLAALNHALNGTPFKIAYRVQNELILYFAALRADSPDVEKAKLLVTAIDSILMMKVLPRIEGDVDLLKEPLKALADYTAEYPQSRDKIKEMSERLERGQFTSFWP